MFFPFTKSARRKKLLAEPFPEAWLSILHDNVWLYGFLSPAEQVKLRNAVRIFVAEKFWEGCAGLEVTEMMQVTIAGQACLLLLGFDGYFFDDVKTVLIYPSGFLHTDPDDEERAQANIGEALAGGPVSVSWRDALREGRRRSHSSVVIHEFAHKLGQHFDPREPVPSFVDPVQQRHWRDVMLREFRRLREDADLGRPTLLDTYGTENLGEFFAVATECFFLQPHDLKRLHPDFYASLSAWFKQDPASRR